MVCVRLCLWYVSSPPSRFSRKSAHEAQQICCVSARVFIITRRIIAEALLIISFVYASPFNIISCQQKFWKTIAFHSVFRFQLYLPHQSALYKLTNNPYNIVEWVRRLFHNNGWTATRAYIEYCSPYTMEYAIIYRAKQRAWLPQQCWGRTLGGWELYSREIGSCEPFTLALA